jgi:hypothetical protein
MLTSRLPLRHTLRDRLGGVLAALAASAGCCVCGLVLTFVMAPRQGLQAASVARLPNMGPAEVAAADPGDTILISGVLAGNAPLLAGSDLVAYRIDEWQVTVTGGEDGGESKPFGRWQSHATTTPELVLETEGQPLQLLASSHVRLSGPLHEALVASDSALVADDAGEPRADGTLRYRGLANGDPVTVLGEKHAVGGIVPERLFLGDRTAFEASEQQAASNFLISGLASLALAPVVLIGGVLAAVLWRRR